MQNPVFGRWTAIPVPSPATPVPHDGRMGMAPSLPAAYPGAFSILYPSYDFRPPVQSPEPPGHAAGPESAAERPPHAVHIDWSARYPREVLLEGPPRREVAITFDDGPDDIWTPQVLDALSRTHTRATFFCVGQRVRKYPSVFRRMIREGHVVGNHSWDHANLSKIPLHAVRQQIISTEDEMFRLAGVRPAMLRPPYGAMNDTVIQEAIRLHYKIVMWNVDSLDWEQLTARQITSNILSHVRPGAIILLHSAGGVGQSLKGTVDALPVVIGSLHRLGYTIKTADELLGIPAYKTG